MNINSSQKTVDESTVHSSKQRKNILMGVCVALMAVIASVSGLNVAQQQIAVALDASQSEVLWMINIYAVPREQQGVASALNDITREFGTALGVALLGAVFSAGYHGAITPQLKDIPDDVALEASKGIANALASIDKAAPYAQKLAQSAQKSFVYGWQQSMWAGVAVMIILLIYVLSLAIP